MRVKGQVVKDKYGDFCWDKTAVDIRYQQPSVEVEFGKPVPEIDQSDIILKDLQANQSQGFLKDKIKQIKQTAQGIVDQIKGFLAIFKPQAQISSFIGDAPLEATDPRALPTGWDESLDNITEQSDLIASQAEQIITQENATTIEEDLLKIKAGLEQAIREKQAELDQLLLDDLADENTTTSLETPFLTGQATTTLCNQATNQEPAFEKVIFNEIAWMGTTKSASDEWIELKSISIKPVDLNGWQIFNKSQNLKIFLYLLICSLLKHSNFFVSPNRKTQILKKFFVSPNRVGLKINIYMYN